MRYLMDDSEASPIRGNNGVLFISKLIQFFFVICNLYYKL